MKNVIKEIKSRLLGAVVGAFENSDMYEKVKEA